MMRVVCISLLALLLGTAGCRSVYYKVWEKLGREKRDLLRSEVSSVKDQQKESAEHFKDALTRLQEAYGKPQTKLQSVYEKLKSDDERARREAENLETRIAHMNRTASDLFEEWKTETDSFTNPEFKVKSRAAYERARKRFESLSQSLEHSAERMRPVLTRLHETTLFLKHNLNAESLGGMRHESQEIEQSLEALLEQVDTSIREADEFLSILKSDES